jgi:hypothetical protein
MAVLASGRPFYIAALRKAATLARSQVCLANKRTQFWNKLRSIQLTLTKRK